MSARKETRQVKRPCAAVKDVVILKAVLEVTYQGMPRMETFHRVIQWENCNRKAHCGKKCNYFYPPDEADFHAGDDKSF